MVGTSEHVPVSGMRCGRRTAFAYGPAQHTSSRIAHGCYRTSRESRRRPHRSCHGSSPARLSARTLALSSPPRSVMDAARQLRSSFRASILQFRRNFPAVSTPRYVQQTTTYSRCRADNCNQMYVDTVLERVWPLLGHSRNGTCDLTAPSIDCGAPVQKGFRLANMRISSYDMGPLVLAGISGPL